MEPILDFTEKKGLVFCAKPNEAQNNSEILYLSEARKLGVEAVLFRRYYQNEVEKPTRSEPVVCIFNKNDAFFNSVEHIKLHAALWSAGRNEVYILKSSSRLDIINARTPAEPDKYGNLSIKNILLASSTSIDGINKEQFSAYHFCNGTFWEQTEFEKRLDEKNSPYIFLLDYLMTVRKEFLNSYTFKLLPETIDKLLVTSILIKFLEETTDDKGKHTLRTIYKKNRINTFAEAVQQGYCVTILNELANEFNGKFFDKFTEEEKEQISKGDLTILANFLKADIDLKTNQLFLWEQYSFKHLPAEVISAIYENFIQAEAIRQNGKKEKGVIFTPIHLVNLLVDEVMPLNKPELFTNNIFKVLDPACGSGIFLVAAFKRLLQWWAINNSTNGNIQYPDIKTAQKILENNIFGVDVKKIATLISVFSLTTALLDKLTPQEIWNNLKFKDLSKKNIQHDNFFDWAVIAKQKNEHFDLIIGNPPFNIESGKEIENVLKAGTLNLLDFRHKKLPDNNFALHFFECSMLFSKRVCLVIPANVLLYNKAAQGYRNLIFTNYSILKIFDFTHLRRDLFHRTADTPVIAIIADNKVSDKQPIEHIVVKRMICSEKKICFEIDYYDQHKVSWHWATDVSRSFIWKTNLLGGGRLFQLIYRMSSLATIQDFIKTQIGWKVFRGFEGGSKFTLIKKNRVIKILNDGKLEILENTEIKTSSLKEEFMYEPPFMIFEQILGDKAIPSFLIPVNNTFSTQKHLYYNRDFVGISVPEEDEKLLKNIQRTIADVDGNLNSKFYVATTSSSCLVLKETGINQSDVLNFPYPENRDYLQLSSLELLLQKDVLEYYIHLGKAINAKSNGYVLQKKVKSQQLKQFGKTFCDALNEIYAKNDKSWQAGSVYQTNSYTVFQLGFGKKGTLLYDFGNIVDDSIKPLIEDKLYNSGAIHTRIIRVYKHIKGYDCVFFIKPNAQRYWLNSIALRDADDTFMDLKKAGF